MSLTSRHLLEGMIYCAAFLLRIKWACNLIIHGIKMYHSDHLQGAEPVNLEPNKCEGWQWVPWTAIPLPLFLPLEILLSSNYDPKLVFKDAHAHK